MRESHNQNFQRGIQALIIVGHLHHQYSFLLPEFHHRFKLESTRTPTATIYKSQSSAVSRRNLHGQPRSSEAVLGFAREIYRHPRSSAVSRRSQHFAAGISTINSTHGFRGNLHENQQPFDASHRPPQIPVGITTGAHGLPWNLVFSRGNPHALPLYPTVFLGWIAVVLYSSDRNSRERQWRLRGRPWVLVGIHAETAEDRAIQRKTVRISSESTKCHGCPRGFPR